MQFQYKAKKLSGEVIQGTLEADNRKLVINKLQQMRVFPITVKELGGGKGLGADVSLSMLKRIIAGSMTVVIILITLSVSFS